MADLKAIIQSCGIPAERLVYTGRDKPKAYATFQTVTASGLQAADDTTAEKKITSRVTLFTKGDYTQLHRTLIEKLEAAGYYINEELGAENYEPETGYYVVPITVQELKE